MATFSVIKQLFVKNWDVMYKCLECQFSNFMPKTAIHTEQNSTDPNTFLNSMMSCTSQYILINHGKTKLIKLQKNDKISPN